MDVDIDGVNTHDFCFQALGNEKNILLNSKSTQGLDVILRGRTVAKGERVLLTEQGAHGDRDSAWRIANVEQREDRHGEIFHCLLTFEGVLTES